MPRARLLPAALLPLALIATLPLLGCGGDDAESDDPEAAQVSEEQEDVNEAREDLEDAREDLADADEEIADARLEVKEAILEKEELEDRVGDAERQLDKERADLQAEKMDAEPDLANDPDIAPVLPDAPDAEADDATVKVETEPGVDVEVEKTAEP